MIASRKMGILSIDVQLYDVFIYSMIALLTGLIYFLFLRPFLHPLRKLPGTNYVPLVGNMRELMSGEAMDCTLKFINEHGPIFRYYFMFGFERVCVASPECMKHILVTNCKNYIKPPSRMRFMAKILGEGLILSEGKRHTVHKRLMSPAFKYNSITKMVPKFQLCIDKMADIWEKKICGNEKSTNIAVGEDLCRATLDIIGLTAFGYEFNSIEDPCNPISIAFQSLLQGSGLSWKFVIPGYFRLPFSDVQELKKHIMLMHSTVSGIVKKKHQEMQPDQGADGEDLLDMLMSARDAATGTGLSDKELRDEVMNIMLAGHETTSTTMSWCLLTLAQRQDIQDKVREEICQVFPNQEEKLSWDKLEQLQYCDCVIKELLRMFPPVPLTIRQALREDVITGYQIPAQTIILLAIGPMMRQEYLFEDPNSFKPERFYDFDAAKKMYEFLPFLIGPRMCLGYKFALMELKSFMVVLVRKFVFEMIDGQKYTRKSRITMKPDPSLQLKVSKIAM